jgi:FAD/FMN-containing dehydrogenase
MRVVADANVAHTSPVVAGPLAIGRPLPPDDDAKVAADESALGMSSQRPHLTGAGMRVNDIHSQLNETVVADVIPVDSLEAIRQVIVRSRAESLPIAVSGGRHAMGGQQFCSGGLLLDTRPLGRVLTFDPERGTIDVEAGIQWPALLAYLSAGQAGRASAWAIRQKQTGADRLSLGGALAANVHGRGLIFKPIVDDVESFTLVDGFGEVHVCSREENTELFRLAIGGYGLVGVIYSVKLQLIPRRRLERVVEVREIEDLIDAFDDRIERGFLYGDFQFAINPADPYFLRQGVFSCYRPVDDATPIRDDQRALSTDEWRKLLYLAHVDKAKAWELYSTHYLATAGQVYLSDAHQVGDYVDDYHRWLDQLTGAADRATEMITEIYVPRDRLADFMGEVADDFRRMGIDVVYGTIRLIERDDVTFLPWARDRWACVIFNLHTVHTVDGLEHAETAFQRLIDMAIARGGNYFLTYHRWARPDQFEACYPEFRDFLAAKRRYDPDERFQSDWYRHHATLLA